MTALQENFTGSRGLRTILERFIFPLALRSSKAYGSPPPAVLCDSTTALLYPAERLRIIFPRHQ
jgi:hypothetical protein